VLHAGGAIILQVDQELECTLNRFVTTLFMTAILEEDDNVSMVRGRNLPPIFKPTDKWTALNTFSFKL
jgi:hypothetical protein